MPKSVKLKKKKKDDELAKASVAPVKEENGIPITAEEDKDYYLMLFMELVQWLTHPEGILTGHNLMDRDALVVSKGLVPPAILDLKERYQDASKMILGKPFNYVTKGVNPSKYKVTINKSTPSQVFRRGEFSGDDFKNYSYQHSYILLLMLKLVNKWFRQFVIVLNHSMENRNAVITKSSDMLRRSTNNLQYILKLLKANHQGYMGISIPDLFADDHQSAFQTHHLKYYETENSVLSDSQDLYTYMYSRETSQAFCEVLGQIIDQKLQMLETELKTDADNGPGALDIETWIKKMPKTNSKERNRLVQRILMLPNGEKESENKIELTAGQLMFIYRSLQNCGVILPDVGTGKLAIALEILTGKSHLVYQ